MNTTSTTYTLNPGATFTFKATGVPSQTLADAFTRYGAIVFGSAHPGGGGDRRLAVDAKQATAGATITLDCETKSGTLTTYDPLTFNASTVPITETMPAHLNHSRRLKSLVSFPDSFRVVDARLEAG